jgi:mRNA (2'-O-methyladenosine-N6-)-methyltransferase
LHYEVDWDERDGNVNGEKGKEKGMIKKPYRIGIGMGPDGKDMQVASDLMT